MQNVILLVKIKSLTFTENLSMGQENVIVSFDNSTGCFNKMYHVKCNKMLSFAHVLFGTNRKDCFI